MQISYEECIEKINNGEIISVCFKLCGYAHYNKCTIKRIIDILPNKRSVTRIEIKMTNDNSETVSFLDSIEEEYKVFNLGRKGKFTLKQAWNKIEILDIKSKPIDDFEYIYYDDGGAIDKHTMDAIISALQ